MIQKGVRGPDIQYCGAMVNNCIRRYGYSVYCSFDSRIIVKKCSSYCD